MTKLKSNTKTRAWVYVFKIEDGRFVMLNRWDERIAYFFSYEEAAEFCDNNEHLIDERVEPKQEP